MLSLQLPLLKKSDAAQEVLPQWHPNFRNYEKLPDTKVVRTTFFINVAAVTLAAALVLLTGYREMRIRDLTRQIAETQAEIDRNQKQSNEAERLSKIFADEEKKLLEVAAFTATPVSPSEMVLLLGETLPKEVQIELVDLRYGEGGNTANAQCVLRGVVAGTKDQASGIASSYVETLGKVPKFAEIFDSVRLNSINPDPRSNLLDFEIVMKFKAAGKEKKKP
jgi:hypothetical protein